MGFSQRGPPHAGKLRLGATMQDLRKHLEKMRAQAAECELIRDLATDPQKRELFDRLAQHHNELARHIELAIAERNADAE
jgi:hypothetical protein